MAAGGSKGAVLLALLGNFFITIIKFIAFLLSGSGAMLSESIHSFADTSNQGLMFIGIRRSERKADALFPYGYGAERYLFALLSAVGVFVLGCGVTIYHGVSNLIHPPELTITWHTWVVLAVSLVIEALVLKKVMAVVKDVAKDKSFFEWLRHSTDPTVPAVLFEDGVAVLGVIVAALGIVLAKVTGSHVPDALASIIIGLMLGAVAIWLGLKNRQLILGQSVATPVEEAVVEFLDGQPTVARVEDFRTRVMGAEAFRVKADIQFDGRPLGQAQAKWVAERLPELTDQAAIDAFSAEFGHRIVESLGDEVDRIERELFDRFPRMRYVDIEAE